MALSETQKKLYELSEGQISNWSKEADFRLKNHKWLRYSGNVAIRILAAMEDKKGMTQKKLAGLMGVSPQQISKLLKGNENLTLETIAKFSEVLGVELISFPDYKYSVPAQSRKTVRQKKASDQPERKKPYAK